MPEISGNIAPFGTKDPEETPLSLRIRCHLGGTSPSLGTSRPVKSPYITL